MIRRPLPEDSLRIAFRRIEDFQSVHEGKSGYGGAFRVLRESLGMDEDFHYALGECLTELFGEDLDAEFASGIIFGLMVGLIAADHAEETSKP